MFRSCIGVKRCLWYPFQLVERVVEISLCGPSVLYSCSGKENSNHSCCRCDLLSPWGSYLRCDVTCSNLLYCSWILISMLYKCTLPLEPAQLKLEVALFIVLTRHVNYNTMYLWWPTHNLSLKSVPKIRYPAHITNTSRKWTRPHPTAQTFWFRSVETLSIYRSQIRILSSTVQSWKEDADSYQELNGLKESTRSLKRLVNGAQSAILLGH